MEPPKKKVRVHTFQETWKKGRPWLLFNVEEKAMTCEYCKSHQRTKGGSGFGRDAWIKGCKRLKLEVVVEHERSKPHREAHAAAQTKKSVEKQGGMFACAIAQRDSATTLAMKLLLWVIKENVALDKWNSLKGRQLLLDF